MQDTIQAGEMAGLKVLRIINQPSAAALALAYSLDSLDKDSAEANLLIFDLGGGFLDASIIASKDGVLQVKSSAGIPLGGMDLSMRLVEHFINEFKRKYKKSPVDDHGLTREKLQLSCEAAKRTLSASAEANIEIDSLFEGIDFCTLHFITRAKFEELCSDLFKRTLDPVEKALKDAKMDKSSINEIVLVGGSTRIPKIQELLQDFFNGKELNKSINPDEAVAYGAAIQAAILTGDQSEAISNLHLLDVTPLDLGIVTSGGMDVLIKRNTTLPTKQTRTVDTSDGKEVLVVEEGYLTHGPDPLYFLDPNGTSQMEITFEVDANGILDVSAIDKSTDQQNKITITITRGLWVSLDN